MINFDFDELLDNLRMYYRVILFVVGLIALALMLWFLQGHGGRREVGEKITEIKEVVKTGERRADEIIDATKAREEAAKNEVSQDISAVSADALPDKLSGLLSDFRNGR